jgi:hypothetical protein
MTLLLQVLGSSLFHKLKLFVSELADRVEMMGKLIVAKSELIDLELHLSENSPQ